MASILLESRSEVLFLSPPHGRQSTGWAAEGLKCSLGSWGPFTETLVNITQQALLSRDTFIIWTRRPAWSWEICLSFGALQRREELAGTSIGLHYLAAPLARVVSPQDLILNGVVSYFLTLQSINTEGKNKQAMSQIRESPIYKTSLIYTAGIPSVLPSTVAISQSQPPHFSERLSRDGISASLMPFTLIQQGLLSGTYVQEPQRPNRRESHYACLQGTYHPVWLVTTG